MIHYERNGVYSRRILTFKLKETRQYSMTHNISLVQVKDFLNKFFPDKRFLNNTRLTVSEINALDSYFNVTK